MSGRPIVWSYGGGVQSVAIAALILRGELPRPERVVFADTGRERSTTWPYTERWVLPRIPIERAGHDLATVDLRSRKGDVLLPLFTKTGKLPTFCSNEWKARVVERWLRRHGYGPKRPVREWIGFSVDEVHRAGPSGKGWITREFPLLTIRPTRREECQRIIASVGWPDAPRSSCWMCPLHRDEEWRDIRDRSPEDWRRAVALEAALLKEDALYLHRSTRPLAEAPIDGDGGGHDGGCDSGYCFF